MDQSGAPWRVLEDTQPAETARSGGPPKPADDASGERRVAGLPLTTLVGIGLACVLAAAAFFIAASAPRGSVVVDSGGIGAGAGVPGSGAVVARASAGGGHVVVDVQGAVVEPGIRTLPAGSRVADAVEAAGGYGPRVDAARAGRELNLAAELKDGDRVVVPSRDDPPAAAGPSGGGGSGGSTGGAGGGPVDLNSATAAQLDELPGVGPVTAQKIIAARAEQPFATVDELLDRKIVGASTFEKLRGLVTVR
jgi:competence protein ComEA